MHRCSDLEPCAPTTPAPPTGPRLARFEPPRLRLGDRVYRIPPISALDAAETVRAIKAAPLLFGYRGSEQVDVPAVEDLIRRVAQLKIDLPQLSQLDLGLVHATVDGVSVLHATGRVDPMLEPRSDLFVRRLTDPLDDTLSS